MFNVIILYVCGGIAVMIPLVSLLSFVCARDATQEVRCTRLSLLFSSEKFAHILHWNPLFISASSFDFIISLFNFSHASAWRQWLCHIRVALINAFTKLQIPQLLSLWMVTMDRWIGNASFKCNHSFPHLQMEFHAGNKRWNGVGKRCCTNEKLNVVNGKQKTFGFPD